MTAERSFPHCGRWRSRVVGACAIAMCVLAAGCSATARSVAGGPSDAELTQQVHERIRSNPKLSYVTLDVRDGIAYLGGWVSTGALVQEARRTAASVTGIKEVWTTLGVGMYDHNP